MVILHILNPFLKTRNDVYNTCRRQAYGVLLKVPNFASSVYKSTKHFCLSFAYNAPKICNDLPDDVYSATSLHIQKEVCKSIPTLFSGFVRVFLGALTSAMSLLYDYGFFAFLYSAPRPS